jgi:hypothetical protein
MIETASCRASLAVAPAKHSCTSVEDYGGTSGRRPLPLDRSEQLLSSSHRGIELHLEGHPRCESGQSLSVALIPVPFHMLMTGLPGRLDPR